MRACVRACACAVCVCVCVCSRNARGDTDSLATKTIVLQRLDSAIAQNNAFLNQLVSASEGGVRHVPHA